MIDLTIWVLQEAGVVFMADFPPYLIRLCLVFINVLLCMGVYAVFRAFVSQGSVLLGAEPGSVIRNGILLYFAVVLLFVILSLTIVLLPVALLILLIGMILAIIGQTSLAMLVGIAAGRKLKKKLAPVMCLLSGLIILNVSISIPYIGLVISYIFIPMLSVGLTVTAAINGLIKKKFYYAPFKKDEKAKNPNNDAIRNIIMNKAKEP
jgi:hypothetical protein